MGSDYHRGGEAVPPLMLRRSVHDDVGSEKERMRKVVDEKESFDALEQDEFESRVQLHRQMNWQLSQLKLPTVRPSRRFEEYQEIAVFGIVFAFLVYFWLNLLS